MRKLGEKTEYRLVTTSLVVSVVALTKACGSSPVVTEGRALTEMKAAGATEGGDSLDTANIPGADGAAQRIARDLVDNSASFEALLALERDQRIEADRKLNERVFALEERMDKFSVFVIGEIARLDKSDADMLAQLQTTSSNLRSVIADSVGTLRKEAEEREKALQESIAANKQKIQEIENEIARNQSADAEEKKALEEELSALKGALASQEEELNAKITDTAKILTEAQKKGEEALRSQIEQSEARLAQQIADLDRKKSREIEQLSSEYSAKLSQTRLDTERSLTQLQSAIYASAEDLWDSIDRLDRKTADRLGRLMEGQEESEKALREAMQHLGNSMQNELDYKVRRIEAEQKAAEEAVEARFSSMQERQQIEAKLREAELVKLRSDLEQSLVLQNNELQNAIKEGKEDVVELLNKESDVLLTQIRGLEAESAQQIARLASEQEAFRKFAQQTYATKNDLLVVRSFAESVMDVTNTLGKKIDENDERAQELIAESVYATKADLEREISAINATIDGVRGEFTEKIGTYVGQMKQMGAKVQEEIASVQKSLTVMRGDVLADQTKLRQQMIIRMEKQATEFEFLAQANKKALSDKIRELDARIDQTDASLVEAQIAAKQELADAIAFEQEKRNEIQQSLDKLAQELEQVAELARSNRDMAKAQQFELKRLGEDFAKEQVRTAERFKVQNTKIEEGLAALRQEFKKDLEEVAESATEMVKDLDASTKEQFKQNAMEMAELKQKQAALEVSMADLIGEINEDIIAQDEIEAALPELTTKASTSLADLILSIRELQQGFIDSIGPNQDNPGPVNDSFAAIQAQCDGNPEATFANAMGSDYFDFLAKLYVRELMIGSRDAAKAQIFFKQPQVVSADRRLAYNVAVASTQPEGASANKNCLTMIQSWARNVFSSVIEKNGIAKGLVDKLTKSKELNRQVIITRNQAIKVNEVTASIEKLIGDQLGSAKDDRLVTSPDDRPSVMARLTSLLIEGAKNQLELREREYAFNRMKETQEKLLENQLKLAEELQGSQAAQAEALKKQALQRRAEIASNSQRIMAHMAQLEKKLSGRVEQVARQTQNLQDSYKQALNVMMALAGRAGYPDLQASIIQAAKPIEYTPVEINMVKPIIAEIQHFYSKRTIEEFKQIKTGSMAHWNKDARLRMLYNENNTCTGLVPMRGAGVKTYNGCWVNFRGVPLNQAIGHVRGMFFRVFGAADKLKVWGFGSTVTGTVGKEIILKAGSNGNGVFDLASNNLFPGNNWQSIYGIRKMYFQPLSHSMGDGRTVSYSMKFYSPLVLDFVSIGYPKSVSPGESRARFDLENDGSVKTHGWINGHQAGFLALDRNKDGMITHGGELFGQATIQADGKPADNGYEALAQCDVNQDGFIDSKDRIYSDLLVWFDYNGDGVSDKGELKKLQETGVTRIGVKYAETASDDALREGNWFKYQAKFWGPKGCPADGCKSYDVFFGTSVKVAEQ